MIAVVPEMQDRKMLVSWLYKIIENPFILLPNASNMLKYKEANKGHEALKTCWLTFHLKELWDWLEAL